VSQAAAQPTAPRTTVDQLADQERWLAPRLRAARDKARRDAFAELGVEDPAKFKADLDAQKKKLDDYERVQEEQKRASMTEVDRLKADLVAKDQRIAELEAQIRAAQGEVQSTKADVVVQQTIGDHIDPSMWDYAKVALRQHLKALPKDQLRKFGPEEAGAFFAKLAKEKPRFAREAAATPAAKPPPVKRPLSNGASPKAAAPPGPAQPANGKKPASQMTKAELDAAWKRNGASRAPG
jgi:hypothetical protein